LIDERPPQGRHGEGPQVDLWRPDCVDLIETQLNLVTEKEVVSI
jgi:hypothetical protein